MIYKTIIPWFLFVQAAGQFAGASESSVREHYNVERIHYSNLVKHSKDTSLIQDHELRNALSEEGIVSITGIAGFAELKRDTLTWLHACIMDQGDTNHKTIHEDGTIRRTMASITVPGPGGAQPFKFANHDNSEDIPASCIEFSKKLGSFRLQVDSVIKEFAKRLSSEMESSLEKPLMETEGGSYSFSDIYSVVTEGHHLEHFHSYQKLRNESKHSTSSGLRNDRGDTIEMHVDQGFFIAFTPGLMVTHKKDNYFEPDLSVPLKESDGFYIETSDGEQIPLHFDARDELIFMMGDGVNQYINPKLDHNPDGTKKKGIRATPHKVVLKSHDANVARVWYGRMALPPPLAYHSAEKMTHGEIRSLANKRGAKSEETDKVHQGIGCSSPDTMRLLSGGDDSGTDITCQDDESIYCWARCMSLLDQKISKAKCAEKNLQVQCINPRNQFAPGKKHGDFYPACSNTTEAVTGYPKLPNYPANETICHDDAWSEYSATKGFQHSFNLTTDKTTAMFMWSVLDDKKTVKGKLVFRGLFGYISLGPANLDPKARHKGMNGATVVMALPFGGGEYSSETGLDLAKTGTIHEYLIDHQGSAFRHWSTPLNSSSSQISSKSAGLKNIEYADVNATECFTSLIFETDRINDKLFNTSGSDEIIWAANGDDYFVGHHSRNRARFSVHWQTGKAAFYVAPQKDVEATPSPTPTPTLETTITSHCKGLEMKPWMTVAIGFLSYVATL